MTVRINEEEYFSASFALKRKSGSPRSVAATTPTNLTRTDKSSYNDPFRDIEIESTTTLRDFDFPIRALKTSRNILKTICGNEFTDIQHLGTGSNSLVYTALRNDEMVAIKMLQQTLCTTEMLPNKR